MGQKLYYHVKIEKQDLTGVLRDEEVTLYSNGKPADYFIMILEGRVQVTIGKENLAF